MWTLFPAPTLQTLALAVVVPEVTPRGIAACLLAAAPSARTASALPRSTCRGAITPFDTVANGTGAQIAQYYIRRFFAATL